MNTLEIIVVSDIGAPPAMVYGTLRDYQTGHPSILPAAFTDYQVVEGGVGAGTVVRVTLRAMGRGFPYTLQVTEPEPGRILAEEDTGAGTRTTFTVDALDGGARSRVTISTVMRAPRGPLAWIQSPMTANFTRKLYKEELANLNTLAQQKSGS